MKHKSIYGPSAGRFLSLEQCPLWDEPEYEDGEPTPNYYGQTRALAEFVGGSLLDLAGGCVGVVVREDLNGNVLIAALDPDMQDSNVAVWMEDHEGERVDDEPALIPFRWFA
jgi:hypothetical protein